MSRLKNLSAHRRKRLIQGMVVEAKANYFIFQSGFHRFYVYEKDCTRELGDFLTIRGKVAPFEMTEYESRFSFSEYLGKLGVSQSLNVYDTTIRFQWPLRFRHRQLRFLASFSEDAAGLLDSLLFDHRDYSLDLIQQASALGCLYFLSASGVLYGGFLRLVEKILSLRFKDKEVHLASWLLATLLVPFAFYKVGIWRVYLLRSAALYCERKEWVCPPRFTLLSFLGLASLLINPYLGMSSGFLFGYALSFVLALSGDIFRKFPGKRKDLVIGLFVLAFMLPLLSDKASFHLLSPVYSFLLAPLIYPFCFLGFISYLTLPAPSLLNPFASFIGGFLKALVPLDLEIPLGSWDIGLILFYYLLIFLYLSFSEIGAKRMKRVLLSLGLATFVIHSLPLGNGFSSQVSFINVGQGDAILIREGYHALMIDTGGSLSFDMAKEVDIPFLRKNHINHLDYLIASHGDFDHIGAASSLRSNFKVDHYLDSAASFPLSFGSMTLTNYNVYGGEAENEESLVIGTEFMGKKWLFTGDAPVVIELAILQDHPELDCDILKVGHHGSNTSSCLPFLEAITPEVAIISVGKKNHYGHPSKEIIDRLTRLAIPIRRTDVEGTITYERYNNPFRKADFVIYPVNEGREDVIITTL
jgi:competence protein ComEC